MLKALIVFVSTLTFVAFPASVSASMYINEFASDTSGNTGDEDWAEIYNSGPDTVDLSLYRLRDSTPTNKKDLSGSLPAGGFAAFDWTDRLNKTGDTIKLLLIADETTPVDQVAYGDNSGSVISAPSAGQSGGRQSDGNSTWVLFSTTSKEHSNNSSIPAPTSPPATPTTVTPTPAPATPTSVPPTSTPTSKPTSTPTPKPTTSNASPTPTTTNINQGQEETVLGIQNENTLTSDGPTEATPTPKTAGWKTPAIAAVLIFPGLGMIGYSIYSYLKKAKDGTIEGSDFEDS